MIQSTSSNKKNFSSLKGNNVITKYTVPLEPDNRFKMKHRKEYHIVDDVIVLDSDDEGSPKSVTSTSESVTSTPNSVASTPKSVKPKLEPVTSTPKSVASVSNSVAPASKSVTATSKSGVSTPKSVAPTTNSVAATSRELSPSIFSRIYTVKLGVPKRASQLKKEQDSLIVISDSDDDFEDCVSDSNAPPPNKSAFTKTPNPTHKNSAAEKPPSLTDRILRGAAKPKSTIPVTTETVRRLTRSSLAARASDTTKAPWETNASTPPDSPNTSLPVPTRRLSTQKATAASNPESVAPKPVPLTPLSQVVSSVTVPMSSKVVTSKLVASPVQTTAPMPAIPKSISAALQSASLLTSPVSVVLKRMASEKQTVASKDANVAPKSTYVALTPTDPKNDAVASCDTMTDSNSLSDSHEHYEEAATKRNGATAPQPHAKVMASPDTEPFVNLHTSQNTSRPSRAEAPPKPGKATVPSSGSLLKDPTHSKIQPNPTATQAQGQNLPPKELSTAGAPRALPQKSKNPPFTASRLIASPSFSQPARNVAEKNVAKPPMATTRPRGASSAPTTPRNLSRGFISRKSTVPTATITSEYLEMISSMSTRDPSVYPPVRNPLLTPLKDKVGIEYSLPSPGYRKSTYIPRLSAKESLKKTRVLFRAKEEPTKVGQQKSEKDWNEESKDAKRHEVRDKNQNIVLQKNMTPGKKVSVDRDFVTSGKNTGNSAKFPVKLLSADDYLDMTGKNRRKASENVFEESFDGVDLNHVGTREKINQHERLHVLDKKHDVILSENDDVTDFYEHDSSRENTSKRGIGAERLLKRNAKNEIERQISLSKTDDTALGTRQSKLPEKDKIVAGFDTTKAAPSSPNTGRRSKPPENVQKTPQSQHGRRVNRTPTQRDITYLIDEITSGERSSKKVDSSLKRASKKKPLKHQTQNEQMNKYNQKDETPAALARILSGESRSSSQTSDSVFHSIDSPNPHGKQKNYATGYIFSESSDSSDLDGVRRMSSSSQNSSEYKITRRASSKSSSQGSDQKRLREDIENHHIKKSLRKKSQDINLRKRLKDSLSPDASPALKRARSIYQMDDKKLISFIDNLLEDPRANAEREARQKDAIHPRRALFTSVTSSPNRPRSMLREGPDHPLTKIVSVKSRELRSNSRKIDGDVTIEKANSGTKRSYVTSLKPSPLQSAKVETVKRRSVTKPLLTSEMGDSSDGRDLSSPTLGTATDDTSFLGKALKGLQAHKVASAVVKLGKRSKTPVPDGTLVSVANAPSATTATSTSSTSDSTRATKLSASSEQYNTNEPSMPVATNTTDTSESIDAIEPPVTSGPNKPLAESEDSNEIIDLTQSDEDEDEEPEHHHDVADQSQSDPSSSDVHKDHRDVAGQLEKSKAKEAEKEAFELPSDSIVQSQERGENSSQLHRDVSDQSRNTLGESDSKDRMNDVSKVEEKKGNYKSQEILENRSDSSSQSGGKKKNNQSPEVPEPAAADQSQAEETSLIFEHHDMNSQSKRTKSATVSSKSHHDVPDHSEKSKESKTRGWNDSRPTLRSSKINRPRNDPANHGDVVSQSCARTRPLARPRTPATRDTEPPEAAIVKKMALAKTVIATLVDEHNKISSIGELENPSTYSTQIASSRSGGYASLLTRGQSSGDLTSDTFFTPPQSPLRGTMPSTSSHEDIIKQVTEALEGALSKVVMETNDAGNERVVPVVTEMKSSGNKNVPPVVMETRTTGNQVASPVEDCGPVEKAYSLLKETNDLVKQMIDLEAGSTSTETNDLASKPCDLGNAGQLEENPSHDLELADVALEGHKNDRDLGQGDNSPEEIGRDLAKEVYNIARKVLDLNAAKNNLENQQSDLETQIQDHESDSKDTDVTNQDMDVSGHSTVKQGSKFVENSMTESESKKRADWAVVSKNTEVEMDKNSTTSKLNAEAEKLLMEPRTPVDSCPLPLTEPEPMQCSKLAGIQATPFDEISEDHPNMQSSKSAEILTALSNTSDTVQSLSETKISSTQMEATILSSSPPTESPEGDVSPPHVSDLPPLDDEMSTSAMFDVDHFFDDGMSTPTREDDSISHIDLDFPEFPCEDVVPDLTLQEYLKPEMKKPDPLPEMSDSLSSEGSDTEEDQVHSPPLLRSKKRKMDLALEPRTRTESLEHSEFMMSQLLSQSISSQESSDGVCGSDLLKEMKMFQARSPPLTPRNPRKRRHSPEPLTPPKPLPLVHNQEFQISYKKHGPSLSKLVRQKKKDHEVDKMEEILLSDLKNGGFRQTLENNDKNDDGSRTSDCDKDTKRAINLMKKDWGTLPELLADTKVFEGGRLRHCHHTMTLKSHFTDGSFETLPTKMKSLVSSCSAQTLPQCQRIVPTLLNTAVTRVQTYQWLLRALQYHPDCKTLRRIIISGSKENRFHQSPLTFQNFKSAMLQSGARASAFSNQDVLRVVKEEPSEPQICEKCSRRRRKAKNLLGVVVVLSATVHLYPLTLQHQQQIDFATFLLLLLKDHKFLQWSDEVLTALNVILQSMKNWPAMKILLTRRILAACPSLQNIQQIAFELLNRSPQVYELRRILSFAILKLHVFGEDAESVILDDFNDPEALVDIADNLRPDNLELLLVPNESEEQGIGSQKRSFFHLSLLLPLLEICIGNKCKSNANLIALERISSILRSTNKRIRDNGAIYRSQVKYELSLFLKNLRILIQRAPKIQQSSIFKYLRSAPVHAEVVDNQTEEEGWSDDSSGQDVSYNDGDDEVKVQPFQPLQKKNTVFDDELDIAEVIKSKILKSGKKGL